MCRKRNSIYIILQYVSISKFVFFSFNLQVLKAIQSGTSALKKLTDDMDIDKVTVTMDNLAEVLTKFF